MLLKANKSKKRIISIIHHITLFAMLHSTFVAPAQGIIESFIEKHGLTFVVDNPRYTNSVVSESIMESNEEDECSASPENILEPSAKKEATESVKTLLMTADINEGIIGVSKDKPVDSPADNLFKVTLDRLPSQHEKAYLVYDLYGVSDCRSVARSINERLSSGGYLVKKQQIWAPQKEEISASWLKEGENNILFTIARNAGYQYRVKNLSIVFEKIKEMKDLMVLEPPKTYLVKDNNIYIKGFIAGNFSGVTVKAAGKELNVYSNEFEGYVYLTDEIKRSRIITVQAFNKEELLGQEILFIDAMAEADLSFSIEDIGRNVAKQANAFSATNLSLAGASVQIPANAMYKDSEISIQELRKIDIAPMETGMINVTKGGNAYRFLPDGTKFLMPVSISLEYDKSLIPSGYSEKDIRTYYFNTSSKRWVSIAIDSVDNQQKIIFSKTTHFTDYINGIIKAPDSPETNAFLPTTISDIKAADPSSEITLISPPEATQQGGANVTYPIKIPSGRNGLQPNISLRYNNESHSSWIGEGWDISVPAISIDTRWGVPLLDPAKETEIYSLDGQQLMYPDNYLPHRQQGNPGSYTTNQQLRSAFVSGGSKQFSLRNQSSYTKVERMGSSPSNYYWKVTTTDGIVYWYGGKVPQDVTDNKAVLRVGNASSNIVHWGLFRVEDLHGNTINYKYTVGSPSAAQITANPILSGSKYFYLKDIYYNGYNGTDGNYRVEFLFSTTATINRPDIIVDAKLGVKKCSPYRLTGINVKHQSEMVRSYSFSYVTSPRFNKSLLSYVAESDALGTEFYRHTFEYYDDVATNSNRLFKAPVSISLPSIDVDYSMNFGGLNGVDASIINTSEGTNNGFTAKVAAGFQIRLGSHNSSTKNTLLVGAPFGESNSKSKGMISLTDIDGDGLDDILYKTDNGLRYRSNIAVPNTSGDLLVNSFSNTEKTVHNINNFSKNKAYTKIMFGESWDLNFTKFYAGTQRSRTKSQGTIYPIDANSDGLLDIVHDGIVHFNHIDAVTQEPTFTTASDVTPNMVITGSNPVGEPAPQPEEQEDIDNEEPFNDVYDVVRVWQSPVSGYISMYHSFKNDTGQSVTISVEKRSAAMGQPLGNMCIVHTNVISADTQYSHYTSDGTCGPAGLIWVNKGDRLYFRTHRSTTASNPVFAWKVALWFPELDLPYEESNNNYTSNTGSPIDFSDAYSIITSKNEPLPIPGGGTVAITWPGLTVTPFDEVRYRITKRTYDSNGNEVITPIYPSLAVPTQGVCAAGVTTNLTTPSGLNAITITNTEAAALMFEVYSDTNVLKDNQVAQWRPTVTYTPSSIAEQAGISPFSVQAIPNYSVFRPDDYKGQYHLLPALQDAVNTPTWVTPTGSGTAYQVKPNTTIVNSSALTSSDNGQFLFAVKNEAGTVIGKRTITVTNGVISVSNSNSGIALHTGNINVSTYYNTPKKFKFEYYANGDANIAVLEHYKLAVADRTAIIGYNWSSTNPNHFNRTKAVSCYYNDKEHLGPMLNGWGQFLYNEDYDTDPATPITILGKAINEDIVLNPFDALNIDTSLLDNTCDPSLSPVDYQACVEEALANSMGIPDESTDLSNIDMEDMVGDFQGLTSGFNFEMPFIPMEPKRYDSDYKNDRYVGFYNSQYYSFWDMCSGGPGDSAGSGPGASAGGGSLSYPVLAEDDDTDPLPANNQTGMKGINKIHKSASRSYTVGWGVLNYNESDAAYSNATTDFMDLNGDGYPEIITTDNLQKTNMFGGHLPASGNTNFGAITDSDSSTETLSLNSSHTVSGVKKYTSGNATPGQEGTTNHSGYYEVGPPGATIGVSADLGGETRDQAFWIDINGDGLTDRVQKEGTTLKFQMNRGQLAYDSAAMESFNNINNFVSQPGPLSVNLNLEFPASSLLDFYDFDIAVSVDVGVGYSGSTGNTQLTYVDINGDGLIDIVSSTASSSSVRFNTGKAFAGSTSLTASGGNPHLGHDTQSQSLAINGSLGFFLGFPVCCILPVVHIKGGMSFTANSSLDLSQTRRTFKDLNGDGYMDFVRYSNDALVVNYSAIGRTNMLKKVNNPLGGNFTVDYEADVRTYNNPHAKWLMKSVAVYDGYDKVNDGEDTYIKYYEYENGYYDRRERQFYGFETVKTIDKVPEQPGVPGYVYRTSVSKYHNQSFFLKGLLKESYLMAGSNPNAIYSKTENTYVLKLLNTDGTINLTSTPLLTFDTGGTEGRKSAAVLHAETTTSLYEFGSTPIVSKVQMQYNNKARLVKYIYLGDVAITGDEYTAEIDYHGQTALLAKNVIGLPKEIRVKDSNSQLIRRRTTTVLDETKATIGSINAQLDTFGASALTQMTYDQYGNLATKTLPQNGSAQSMMYTYTYDTTEHKYIVEVENSFGETSFGTYSPKFDKKLTDTDIAGNVTTYKYDNSGRLVEVIGPYEAGGYTIRMAYYPKLSNLTPYVTVAAEDFMPVAVTSHYDSQHPGNDIETYSFIDGLGRSVQIKKDVEMEISGTMQEMVTISGKINYDLFAREFRQYHPWFEEKQAVLNYIPNEYNSYYFAEKYYDGVNRIDKQADEEGNVTYITYAIENDFFNNPAQRTRTNFQNGSNMITNISYSDANGRLTSVKNIYAGTANEDIWTSYTYSSIGEELSYTDGEGLTTTTSYDMAGRVTQVSNPDSGVTKYLFDAAGNVVKMQTAALAADVTIPVSDRFIRYTYDYNRLINIMFPLTVGGADNIADVDYEYGLSGNETGRLVWQRDATGEQFFEYGMLGEVTKNTRIVVGPNIPTRFFETNFDYDSWNRIQQIRYPDGEKVNYSYDLGGNLTKIVGEVQGNAYNYVEQIKYDHFGSKIYAAYGNGTEMYYSYTTELRRPYNVHAKTADSQVMFSNIYGYDGAGNITAITNNSTPNTVNNMGGSYWHEFTYDNLNRLKTAEGAFGGDQDMNDVNQDYYSGYESEFVYNKSHGMVTKTVEHDRTSMFTTPNYYENGYSYHDNSHKVHRITDAWSGLTETFKYDASGNIVERSDTNGGDRDLFWDEGNRLRAIVNGTDMQHYIYDASGDRILKGSAVPESLYNNGMPVDGSMSFGAYTTYPSAYIVIDGGGEYTKHYYAGQDRIVSRIGEFTSEIFENEPAPRLAMPQEGQDGTAKSFDEIKVRKTQIGDLTAILKKAGKGLPVFKEYEPAGKQDEDVNDASAPEGETSAPYMAPPPPPAPPTLIYFYHPDHLGTTTYLTDGNGDPYQFFMNLAFGETMTEQHSLTEDYETPYKFSGKELDQETGYYYYGARYYDPKASIWLSVDPLKKKYPNINPYVYCAQNPVKYIDPDGQEIVDEKGKRVTWHREKDGSITWSPNATADIRKVGNAMLKTAYGEEQFTKWDKADTKVYINIDTTTPADKADGFATTDPAKGGNRRLKVKKGDKKVKGQWEAIQVTFFQSVIDAERKMEGKRFYNATEEEVYGANGCHEVQHNEVEQIEVDEKTKFKEELQTPEENTTFDAEIMFRRQYHQNLPEDDNPNWEDPYRAQGFGKKIPRH